jgi:hypothetical protein
LSATPGTCWICGGDGSTGEHKTKRSDLRSVFGRPTQAKPLYRHDARRKNRQVGSIDAAVLKSPSRICPECNNDRTQPHDLAWAHLSEELRSRRPPIAPGTIVRANRIFPYDTKRKMLNVHLYFLKLFGCDIVETSVSIDVQPFADAILNGRPNPNVFLKFGVGPSFAGEPMTGRSNLHVDVRTSDGAAAFAAWDYYVGGLAVRVMFAARGEAREGLIDAWHPSLGTGRLKIADFRS